MTEAEREELQRRVKAPSVSKRDSLRAAIALRRAEGVKQAECSEGVLGLPITAAWEGEPPQSRRRVL